VRISYENAVSGGFKKAIAVLRDAQTFLYDLPFGNLGFGEESFLLKLAHCMESLVRVRELVIALMWDDLGMQFADFGERFLAVLPSKERRGISTEQRKGMRSTT